jgi:hypothetical protein
MTPLGPDLDFNAFPERTEAGIISNECAHDERHVFTRREDLWRDHLFEPLLRWVNEALAPFQRRRVERARCCRDAATRIRAQSAVIPLCAEEALLLQESFA